MRSIALLIIVASSLTFGNQQPIDTQGPGAPNRSAPPSQAAPPPTSYQLIDRALEAKRIDEETAHKYRVFAAFGDSRLPAPYRGSNTEREPPLEVESVGSLLDTFSPQTRAELAPFFMRPDEPGSWIALGTVSGQEPEPSAPPPPPPAGGRGFAGGLLGRGGFAASFSAYAAAGGRSGSFHADIGAGVSSRSAHQSGGQRPTYCPCRTFTAAGGKAKVWARDLYPGDAAKAQALANALTNHIWGKLTALMKEPVGDAAFPSNGGDGALDIYLVHAPTERDPVTGKQSVLWDGHAKSSDPKTCHVSRFLLIDSKNPLVGNRTTNGILSIVAHELFHAIQFAYGTQVACDVPWIRESTATWAENFVYPDPDSEHGAASAYLKLAYKPIDSDVLGHRMYGAYLLPHYREMTSGKPDFMPQMWRNFERLLPRTVANPGAPPPTLQARMQAYRTMDVQVRRGVNDVLERGFDYTWPRFLVRIWNRPPVDAPNGYKRWDRLADSVIAWGTRQVVDAPSGPVTKDIEFPADQTGLRNLPYLSGTFSHFAFKNSVRSVVFVNTIAEMGQPHTSVWGIAKIHGRWKDPENAGSMRIHGGDWTKEFQLAWCRDDPNEDIEELVIVFGNSDWETEKPLIPEKPPQVKAYPTGCTAWTGTTTTTNTITSTDPNITITEVVRSSMRFEVDSALNVPGQPREYWKVISGTLTWSASVTGRCTGQGQGSVAIRDMGPGDEVAGLQIWEETDKMRVMGTQGPWPGDIPRYTMTCPGSSEPPVQMLLMSNFGWFGTDSDRNELAADGKSFGGDFTSRPTGDGSIVTRWQYSFRVSP